MVNINEIIQQQNVLLDRLAKIEADNTALLNALLAALSQQNTRVNIASNTQRDTIPHITAYTYHFNISKSVFRKFPNYERFVAVSFYTTNFTNVVAMKFHKKPTGQSLKLIKEDSVSVWSVHSVDVINRVFGGIAYGKEAKFWNAEEHPTQANTVLLWPSTLKFVVGDHKVVINKPISVHLSDPTPRCTVTKSRIRFNTGFMTLAGNREYEYPFVTFKKIVTDVYDLHFAKTADKEAYEVTPYSGGITSYGYEICSLKLLDKLGLRKTQSAQYSCEAIAPQVVRIRRIINENG